MRPQRPPRSEATKPRFKTREAVLSTILGEAAGLASMSWSNVEAAGVFDEQNAMKAVDMAIKNIEERFVLVLRTDHPENVVKP